MRDYYPQRKLVDTNTTQSWENLSTQIACSKQDDWYIKVISQLDYGISFALFNWKDILI